MKGIKLTKQQIQQIALGVMLTGLGCFTYYRYFLTPKLAQIKEKKVQIEQLSKRLEELQRRAAKRSQLLADIAKAERQWEDLKSRLPNDRELPAILQTINRIAQKHRVVLQNLRPGPIQAADLYYEIPFGLTTTGAYHDVAAFLVEMGNLTRVYKVRDLTLSPAAGGAERPDISIGASFTLVTYQYKGS